MIKFENTEVMNFSGALRGMRNPLNSWDKSDSVICKGGSDFTDCKTIPANECPRICDFDNTIFCIGRNDMDLARRLIKAGSDHRKFLRQIFVSVDITAPLYWWKEFDTYKIGTVADSCSTMHKIHSKRFELNDFSIEHLLDEDCCWWRSGFSEVVNGLNVARDNYLETKDKKYWRQMIQLLPASYNQKRTVTLNYETLRNIYGSRKDHKLDEWRVDFMEWIKSLPYSSDLIIN